MSAKYRYAFAYNKVLHRFEDQDRLTLIHKVTEFYRKHNIMFSYDMIVKSIDRQSKNPEIKRRLTLAEVVTGAKSLVRTTAGQSVSNVEIVRRSDICAKCPLMDEIGGCHSCGAGGKISNWANKLRSFMGSQIPIPAEVKGSYCGFCGCAIASMVLAKKTDFYPEAPTKNATRPDNCWLKTTSINYTNE